MHVDDIQYLLRKKRQRTKQQRKAKGEIMHVDDIQYTYCEEKDKEQNNTGNCTCMQYFR